MGMNRIRARLEALEARSLPPTVIKEEQFLRDDPRVIEADAALDQAEAEMKADPMNPALRSYWIDCARAADSARNHAASRLSFDRPTILMSYRHFTK